jgi:hypothetical protein
MGQRSKEAGIAQGLNYRTEWLPDGTVRIRDTLRKRWRDFFLCFLFGVLWTFVMLLLAGGGGTYPPEDDGFQ